MSIGLADSLNPTTIAPALYLASGERARDERRRVHVRRVRRLPGRRRGDRARPGQLLLSLVPKPDARRETHPRDRRRRGAARLRQRCCGFTATGSPSASLPQPRARGARARSSGRRSPRSNSRRRSHTSRRSPRSSGRDRPRSSAVRAGAVQPLLRAPLLGIVATLTFAGSEPTGCSRSDAISWSATGPCSSAA